MPFIENVAAVEDVELLQYPVEIVSESLALFFPTEVLRYLNYVYLLVIKLQK